MAQLKWTEELKIGNKKIDFQHKELFEKINQLFYACNKGQGRKELKKIINFLEKYIKDHFQQEEKLQEEIEYPDYENHKRFHAIFIDKFDFYKNKIENEGETTQNVIRMNEFLTEWWISHIKEIDSRLGKFLKKIKYAE